MELFVSPSITIDDNHQIDDIQTVCNFARVMSTTVDFVDEKTELPCVFINEKDEFKLIINSHEMNSFDNVDQLISRLEVFLD